MFRGLVAFPITPMDAAGHVDAEALARLVQRLVAAKVDAIGVLGSTGSYPYLSRAERRRAIEAAIEAAAGTPVMAGVGALRTDEAVALTKDARAAGAAAGLLAPVSYTPLTADEVFGHFEAVAGAGLPICIYDNPATTHFTIAPELVERLSRAPGVAAVKSPIPEPDTAAQAIADLRRRVPAGFSVGGSTDWSAAAALLAGADAWHSAFGGLFPQPCMTIRDAVEHGDRGAAERENERLAPLWVLFRRFGSLRALYAAANLTGLCDASPPLPILSLPAEAKHELARVLSRLDLVA